MLKRWVAATHTGDGVRRGQRISAVGLIACLVLGVFAAVYIASRPELNARIGLALFCVVLIASMYAAQAFYDLEGWFEQRLRDVQAARIWDGLKADEAVTPFTLYLRPFVSTDKLADEQVRMVSFRAGESPGAMVAGSDRVEFEGEIEKALRTIGPLVALGQPLEHMGAGRIRVEDEEWQAAFLRLMHAADLIVLLPSARPGTSWEVEQILVSGALERTIVVDPPNDRGAAYEDYDPAAEWGNIRDAFAAHGYVLPEDDEAGLLLHFGASRAPERTIRLAMRGTRAISGFARSITSGQTLNNRGDAHRSRTPADNQNTGKSNA